MNNSKNKNLVFIIAVLLLTNIAVLVYFLGFKKHERPLSNSDHRSGVMIEMLEKEVGFDENQMGEYKKLKEKQRETVRPMFDDMRKAKENLFIHIGDSLTNDSLLSSKAETIAARQRALDLQTFDHFKQVRTLCKPDQLEKYDSAVLRMFRKMGKPIKTQNK
jgi:hypothetical protein